MKILGYRLHVRAWMRFLLTFRYHLRLKTEFFAEAWMERSVGGRELKVTPTLPEAGALLKNTLQQSIQNASRNMSSASLPRLRDGVNMDPFQFVLWVLKTDSEGGCRFPRGLAAIDLNSHRLTTRSPANSKKENLRAIFHHRPSKKPLTRQVSTSQPQSGKFR